MVDLVGELRIVIFSKRLKAQLDAEGKIIRAASLMGFTPDLAIVISSAEDKVALLSEQWVVKITHVSDKTYNDGRPKKLVYVILTECLVHAETVAWKTKRDYPDIYKNVFGDILARNTERVK